MGLFATRIQALGTENAFKVGVDIARAEAAGKDVIRLNLGEPDFDSPANVNRVACQEIEKGNSHYCDPQGLAALREAIAQHLCLTRGIDASPDRVVVTPGAKPPISYSLQAYVEPGDEVVYPSPGFPVYESWVTYMGAKPVPLHLKEERGFACRADDLAPLLSPKTKLVILNSPSNPTGGVLSGSDLAGIAGVIREKCRPDVRIFSDEIYEHILFDGNVHESIAAFPGMLERTIVVSGFSKSFAMTGWRLGYALLPTREEADVFKQLNINIVSCVPPFVQKAGVAALTSETSMEQVSAMVRAFQERRDWIVAALATLPGVSCARPGGAFYVFPNVAGACRSLGVLSAYEKLAPASRARTTPSTLLQLFLLYEHGVATMDRRSFGAIGCEGEHFLRLSIATSLEKLQAGIERIRKGLEDRDGFRKFMAARFPGA